MSTSLHLCGGCNVPFTTNDFPSLIALTPETRPNTLLHRTRAAFQQLLSSSPTPAHVHPQSLVFTCCKDEQDVISIHIYDTDCLSTWVNQSEKPCPTCRASIHQHQIGKTVTQILDIFLNAIGLDEDKDIVTKVLNESDHNNDQCAICTNELPIIPLKFDQKNGRLYHDGCNTDAPHLHMPDLAKIASTIINKHSHLKQKYTPVPLSPLEKTLIDYPLASRVVFIGALSIGAFVLSRNKFGGNN